MKLEWKTCFKVGVSVFLLYLCIHFLPNVTDFILGLFTAAAPLFLGFAIAFILNIIMSGYEKRFFPKSQKKWVNKLRRPICLFGAFITLIAIVSLIIGLVLPEFIECLRLLVEFVPESMDDITAFIDKYNLLSDENIAILESIDWKTRITQLIESFASGIGGVVNVAISTITSLVSGIVTTFIGIIFSVYLLFGKEKLTAQTDRIARTYVKTKWYDKALYFLRIMGDSFRKYIVGQCTEAVILGLLCTVGMLILRFPYATMIGALVGFTALIPIAGAYIGGAVGAFMILIETQSFLRAIGFVAFLLILQQFEGNVIYPRVVGSTMGLPGIWVLAAITIGGGLMGVLGMLIAVPLASTFYTILKNDVKKRETLLAEAASSEELPQEESAEVKTE